MSSSLDNGTDGISSPGYHRHSGIDTASSLPSAHLPEADELPELFPISVPELFHELLPELIPKLFLELSVYNMYNI